MTDGSSGVETQKLAPQRGMSRRTARTIEGAIIALCLGAIVLIFQPFALWLYGIGAGLVVLGGLAFNLIPFCREGVPASKVVKVAIIVVAILAAVVVLGFGTAQLYVWYLGTSR